MIFRPTKKKTGGNKKWGLPILKVGDNVEIPPSSYLKYLGVTFSKKGSFRKHASIVAKRGRAITGASRFLLSHKSVNMKVKRLIYKQIIRPTATYACAIWGSPEVLHPLQVMERWAFRHATGNYRNPITKHFIPQNVLYDEMDLAPIGEFIDKCCEKHMNRLTVHKNKLIQELATKW